MQGWREKYAGAVHESSEPNTWVVGVLPGPHADPDYLTPDAMAVLYSAPYEVHYNSNRWADRPSAAWWTVMRLCSPAWPPLSNHAGGQLCSCVWRLALLLPGGSPACLPA
jgi:hypothetical protein